MIANAGADSASRSGNFFLGFASATGSDNTSLPEQFFQILAPVHHSKNEHVFILDNVNDDILTDSKTPQPDSKIVVARPP